MKKFSLSFLLQIVPVVQIAPVARIALLCLCLALPVLSGCGAKDADTAADQSATANTAQSTAATSTTSTDDARFEDYGDDPITISDPLEPWNRFWFGFNDVLILRVIRPVYNGYVAVTPQEFRSGLSNLLHNVQAPVRVVNRILQGEISMAGVEFGRFLVNSTVGFGGLINVAAKDKPLRHFEEYGANFNHTLARWGVGEGIYLVWPLFGPSTARGTVGLAGDYAASPFFWGPSQLNVTGFWIATGTESALKFNNLGGLINAYETLTKMAVEPYSAVRDAYVRSQRTETPETPVW